MIQLPAGVDIVEFIRHDGSPPTAIKTPDSPRQSVTLKKLRDLYTATLGNGAVEANTLYTINIHLKHGLRLFGESFPLVDLDLAGLQGYVNKRTKEKVRPYTIRKEIRTLRAAWRWGGPMKLTAGEFPSEGLRYPKESEKPPFMTGTRMALRAAITRKLAPPPTACSVCLAIAMEMGLLPVVTSFNSACLLAATTQPLTSTATALWPPATSFSSGCGLEGRSE